MTSVPCAHCGLPVRGADDQINGRPFFCCRGCQLAHAIITECKLDKYYDLRDRLDAPSEPSRAGDRSYQQFDDEVFADLYVQPASDGLASVELYLEGVHCAACVWLVERVPHVIEGVAEVRLDIGRSLATVIFDPSRSQLSVIARFLDSLGYPPHPFHGVEARQIERKEERALLIRLAVAGAIAGNVMLLSFALYGGALDGISPTFEHLFRWVSLGLALPSVLWCAAPFYRGALGALRARTVHMDVPIALGIAAGALQGASNTILRSGEVYFDSVTVLIFFLLAGRFMQRRQQRSATRSTELLFTLAPSTAHLLEGGERRDVPIQSLSPGQTIEVLAGETIAADGIVRHGVSAVDRSLLTGESRPEPIGDGDPVHAGCINLTGSIMVEVVASGSETRLGGLLQLVEESSRRKAPMVLLADRISLVFVVAVIFLALVTVALWWWIDPDQAVDNGIALLIVSCPCALGLATPLAVAAAIGKAARAGILIKGGDALEALARPGRMMLDKTGTLTQGRLAVVEWHGDPIYRQLVAEMERHSSHPVARALRARATITSRFRIPSAPHLRLAVNRKILNVGRATPPVSLNPASRICSTAGRANREVILARALSSQEVGDPDQKLTQVTEHPGRGMTAKIGDRSLAVGSVGFIRDLGPALPQEIEIRIADYLQRGLSPLLVLDDSKIAAVIGLGDPIRDEARSSVTAMKAAGWKVEILSGDHQAVVSAVARQIGIDSDLARGAAEPEAKVEAVRTAAAEGPVVMIGDGVNDAAALAAATVGIGVHGGAEATLAAADVYLTAPGIDPVVRLLAGAAATLAVIRRNLGISLTYNVVTVGLAMAGLMHPLVAAVLMPLSSISVVVSSYRSRTFDQANGSQ